MGEREGVRPDTARVGAQTVLLEWKIPINEFDEPRWEQRSLRDICLSKNWGNICIVSGDGVPLDGPRVLHVDVLHSLRMHPPTP